MKRENMLRWLNLIAFVVMVIVNILASTTLLGGRTTAAVSDRYANLFTPAGITFSIWTVIYVILGISLVMHMFKHDEHTNSSLRNIGLWFVVTCFLNVAWIFLWQYEQILLSTIIIMLLALSMFALYFRLDRSGLFYIGVSIYTGWISIASVASLFVLASSMGFDMFSSLSQIVTFVFVVGASVLAGFVGYKIKSMYFTLAVLWADIGIMIKHLSNFNSNYKLIITGTVLSLIVLTIFIINTIRQGQLQNFNSNNIVFTRR